MASGLRDGYSSAAALASASNEPSSSPSDMSTAFAAPPRSTTARSMNSCNFPSSTCHLRWPVRISQQSPVKDNKHDPTDQDSRTSFPDTARRSIRDSTDATPVPPISTVVAYHPTGPMFSRTTSLAIKLRFQQLAGNLRPTAESRTATKSCPVEDADRRTCGGHEDLRVPRTSGVDRLQQVFDCLFEW